MSSANWLVDRNGGICHFGKRNCDRTKAGNLMDFYCLKETPRTNKTPIPKYKCHIHTKKHTIRLDILRKRIKTGVHSIIWC